MKNDWNGFLKHSLVSVWANGVTHETHMGTSAYLNNRVVACPNCGELVDTPNWAVPHDIICHEGTTR
jgi:hypothetical protein